MFYSYIFIRYILFVLLLVKKRLAVLVIVNKKRGEKEQTNKRSKMLFCSIHRSSSSSGSVSSKGSHSVGALVWMTSN